MLQLIIIVIGCFCILYLGALIERKRIKRAEAPLNCKREQIAAAFKDLVQFYQLNVINPYVTKPNYDERRCYHCNYVESSKRHDSICPWAKIQPTLRLFN